MRRTAMTCLGAVAAAVLCATRPSPSPAGAWTLAEGDGQLIMTSGRRTDPVGAIFRGVARKDTSTMDIFLEYGVTGDLTLGATASGEWTVTTLQLDLRVGVHARYRVWQGQAGDVASAQLGVSLPAEGWFGEPLAGGTAGNVPEIQAGLLYGRGWVSDWGNSFATGEAAFRWRGGTEPDELRFEGTAGHALSRWLMGLVGVYAAVPLGDGEASLKLAPSVALTMWPFLGPNDKKPAEFAHPNTVQLGAVYDVLNPGDGLALNVSVWSRF